MNWNESVWILQKIKKYLSTQTDFLENAIKSGETQIFVSADQPSGATKGDIWFTIKSQVTQTTEENEGE